MEINNSLREKIHRLINEIETRTKKSEQIKELKSILETIKSDPQKFESLKDIYEDAEDVIMLYTSSGPKVCVYDSFIKGELDNS
ncbi:MAG: hypothetical protein ACTSYZ_07230 [Candidatus Helarchaeota archaeon]